MTGQQFLRMRLRFSGLVAFVIWLVLLWKHFHGGVPKHHLLHNAAMPGISCWWDALVLPALTCLILTRARVRLVHQGEETGGPQKSSRHALLGFAVALLVGVMLSVLFTGGQNSALSYLVDGLFILALFLPIYRAESMLGFVLGMTFTFGAVLPLLFASFVAIVAALLYQYVRPVIVRIGLWVYGS